MRDSFPGDGPAGQGGVSFDEATARAYAMMIGDIRCRWMAGDGRTDTEAERDQLRRLVAQLESVPGLPEYFGRDFDWLRSRCSDEVGTFAVPRFGEDDGERTLVDWMWDRGSCESARWENTGRRIQLAVGGKVFEVEVVASALQLGLPLPVGVYGYASGVAVPPSRGVSIGFFNQHVNLTSVDAHGWPQYEHVAVDADGARTLGPWNTNSLRGQLGRTMCWIDSRKLIVVADDGTIHRVEISEGEPSELSLVAGGTDAPTAPRGVRVQVRLMIPGSSVWTSVSASGRWMCRHVNSAVEVWDLTTLQRVRRDEIGADAAPDGFMAISDCGTRVAWVGARTTGFADVWLLEPSGLRRIGERDGRFAIERDRRWLGWSPDGNWLALAEARATGNRTLAAIVFDLHGNVWRRLESEPRPELWIDQPIHWSWRPQSGQLIGVFFPRVQYRHWEHESPPRAPVLAVGVVFHPDTSAGRDSMRWIGVRNADDRSSGAARTDHRLGVRWSPCGRFVAVLQSDVLRIFDALNSMEIAYTAVDHAAVAPSYDAMESPDAPSAACVGREALERETEEAPSERNGVRFAFAERRGRLCRGRLYIDIGSDLLEWDFLLCAAPTRVADRIPATARGPRWLVGGDRIVVLPDRVEASRDGDRPRHPPATSMEIIHLADGDVLGRFPLVQTGDGWAVDTGDAARYRAPLRTSDWWTVGFWNKVGDSIPPFFPIDQRITRITVSSDNRFIAAHRSGGLTVCDVGSGRVSADRVRCEGGEIAFIPQSHLIAVWNDGQSLTQGEVIFFDGSRRRILRDRMSYRRSAGFVDREPSALLTPSVPQGEPIPGVTPATIDAAFNPGPADFGGRSCAIRCCLVGPDRLYIEDVSSNATRFKALVRSYDAHLAAQALLQRVRRNAEGEATAAELREFRRALLDEEGGYDDEAGDTLLNRAHSALSDLNVDTPLRIALLALTCDPVPPTEPPAA